MKKGLDRLEAAGVRNVSLSNLDVLLDVAVEQGYIKAADKEAVRKFRDNPSDESWFKA